ncbi:hypothetical protein BDW02DRAFT_583597 [Decorospora gaudefroyi]|uniref:Uncharacterized protein n=1 Tax=Decorospora gaudefroyi TaxID=184978 RepID=A0A6A5K4Z6_9PLEO|nr:hypothetical protein BDW02DRAFT_583597 [Decorospora gaudefroyi]
MAEKTTIDTSTILKPPFTAQPVPPASEQQKSQTSHQNVSINTTTTNVHEPPRLTTLDSLPTISGRKNAVFLANDDIPQFLTDDLDLSRLNKIHTSLWMAGRPMRARPLHRYKMLGMDLVITQQMDLHLLKFSTKLLLKPLPEYLLDHAFWSTYLCADKDLHASACGFLLSWIWLLVSPVDLSMASEQGLVPVWMEWGWWKAFVKDVIGGGGGGGIDVNTLEGVNKRWQFGDLRLGRINSIYRTRFFFTHFVRGYLYGYNRYQLFFQRKFSWILVVVVLLSLVLSAMQVGTGLEQLENNQAFLRGCYVIVVVSMLAVFGVMAVVSLMFLAIFVFNMVEAVRHPGRQEREREKEKGRGRGGRGRGSLEGKHV